MMSMFLMGDVDRDRDDWVALAQRYVSSDLILNSLISFPEYPSRVTMDQVMALLPRRTWMPSVKSKK